MAINRIQYLALTVRDLEESVDWYCKVLGFKELHRSSKPGVSAVAVGLPEAGISLGLVQSTNDSPKPFHHLNVGLDHLSFAVSSRDELSDWSVRFEEHGVTHSEIAETETATILNFKDPNGIALAFVVPHTSSRP